MSNPIQIEKMEAIKTHFESEAKEFDETILKLIPYYETMVEIMITGLPFHPLDKVEILDLGCGTGTISHAIKAKFPNSKITCLDISNNMLEMAKAKLVDYSDIDYIIADFYDFKFIKKYDAVVSSLAIHHLITDHDKKAFYYDIFSGLKNGGIFINADIVLGSSMNIQDIYMRKWVEFMAKHCSMDEIQNKWLVNYQKEDHPASLTTHFNLMHEAGFEETDVLWKYFNFCVYTGSRTSK